MSRVCDAFLSVLLRPSPPKAFMNDHTRTTDLKRIHALQREKGLQPEDATTLKIAATGVPSSADMNAMQRAKYIAHLHGLTRHGQTGQKKARTRLVRRVRPTPSTDHAPFGWPHSRPAHSPGPSA